MTTPRPTRSAPTAPAPLAGRAPRGWTKMFGPAPREHGFEPLRVEGTLPESLRLTAYFNGPGHFDSLGRAYGHWFDGDGTLAAVRLAGGRAEGAYKTTRSRQRAIEAALGRPLFSAYGTRSAWPLTVLPPTRRVKSTANTAVLCHDGQVFALMEGARPVRIDPFTLTTLGPTDLGVPGLRNYSAHPVRLADGRLISTGLKIARDNHVHLFETAHGRTRRLAEIAIDEPTMVHSFAATETHAVLLLMPLVLDKLRFLLNLGSFADLLKWRPERGTELVVVPLADPDASWRLEVEPFFFWHIAQAFEAGDELCVDLVRYRDFGNSAWLGAIPSGGAPPVDGGTLHRLKIELGARRAAMEPRADVLAEFPIASPARRGVEAETIFCGHDTSGRMSGPIDALLRLDVARGGHARFDLGADEAYPSEVQLVPRSEAADDVWVLALVYDPAVHRSYLAVLDGRAPSAGPVAKVWFDHHVPGRFHGDYLPL